MDLQVALALIGLIVVAVVALTALDRARANRLFRFAARLRARRQAAPAVLSPAHPGHGPLDINPAPPADPKKVLSSDAPVAPRPRKPEDEFESAIASLEEVATMPLDLDPGIEQAKRGRPRPDGPREPDERIDFVVRLPGPGPVARDLALGIFKQSEYLLEKPRFLFGRHAGKERWGDLQHDSGKTSYDDLALAIQMVDARGALDESELNTFAQIGLKLADALQRPTQFSLGFEEALARARELHAFCEAFDVIAAVNVVAAGDVPFRGRAIEKAATALGMQLGALEIFHAKTDLSPGCKHLYSMANLFQPGEFDPARWDTFMTGGLTLFMSVPCAHHPVEVFDRMIAAAKGLCARLDGRLLDQARKPLNDRGIEVIRGQIAEIDEKMRAQGVVPGSATALRLFRASAGPLEQAA